MCPSNHFLNPETVCLGSVQWAVTPQHRKQANTIHIIHSDIQHLYFPSLHYLILHTYIFSSRTALLILLIHGTSMPTAYASPIHISGNNQSPIATLLCPSSHATTQPATSHLSGSFHPNQCIRVWHTFWHPPTAAWAIHHLLASFPTENFPWALTGSTTMISTLGAYHPEEETVSRSFSVIELTLTSILGICGKFGEASDS